MELVGTLDENDRIGHSYKFAVANYILANAVLHSHVGYSQHILVIDCNTCPSMCHTMSLVIRYLLLLK